jgi:hypothetical protein
VVVVVDAVVLMVVDDVVVVVVMVVVDAVVLVVDDVVVDAVVLVVDDVVVVVVDDDFELVDEDLDVVSVLLGGCVRTCEADSLHRKAFHSPDSTDSTLAISFLDESELEAGGFKRDGAERDASTFG